MRLHTRSWSNQVDPMVCSIHYRAGVRKSDPQMPQPFSNVFPALFSSPPPLSHSVLSQTKRPFSVFPSPPFLSPPTNAHPSLSPHKRMFAMIMELYLLQAACEISSVTPYLLAGLRKREVETVKKKKKNEKGHME